LAAAYGESGDGRSVSRFCGCVEHDQRAGRTNRVRRQRIGHAPRHRSQRRLMKHEIAAGDRLGHGSRIRHAAGQQLDLPFHGFQVGPITSVEVIEHADHVAAADERLGDVRTDEPGAAGDERDRHKSSKNRRTKEPSRPMH
jgi:hypothetical protein